MMVRKFLALGLAAVAILALTGTDANAFGRRGGHCGGGGGCGYAMPCGGGYCGGGGMGYGMAGFGMPVMMGGGCTTCGGGMAYGGGFYGNTVVWEQPAQTVPWITYGQPIYSQGTFASNQGTNTAVGFSGNAQQVTDSQGKKCWLIPTGTTFNGQQTYRMSYTNPNIGSNSNESIPEPKNR